MLDDAASPRRTRLSKVVASVLPPETQSTEIGPDWDLREVGMTSLTMVNLMLAIEGEFGFVIPKHELHPDNFKSIGAIDSMLARLEA